MKAEEFASHHPAEVLNQPPLLEDYNLFLNDSSIQDAAVREKASWIASRATEFGAILGSREILQAGVLANKHLPELRTFDRFGNRIDQVDFHPSYHQLMDLGIRWETHSIPWSKPGSGAHVARAVLMYLRHQVDEGTGCPLTMTFAAIPSLRIEPGLAAIWEPRLLSAEYDPRFLPADQKKGVTVGMAMTERQGGSDVRSNTTRAVPLSNDSGAYLIEGHKWFCSAPMCDAFLILAQAPGGLSCFLLPRWTQEGKPNRFHINRLKDKLGNKSNASSEVEFHQAYAWLIGEEGRGVANIIEMVRHTRLDCCLGSSSTMRRAVTEAVHHASHRYAFGRRLVDQPLMMNVLADICIESEAATALSLRIARSFDEAPGNELEKHFSRIATAIGKFWITRRSVGVVAEALECLGGNGYVDEAPLARLYKDAPLNSIWEGSGNVQCLDVLRAMKKDPASVDALFEELAGSAGGHPEYDRHVQKVEAGLHGDLGDFEVNARRLVSDLALALQACVLLKGDATVAEAFCASRLKEGAGIAGTLPSGTDFKHILHRTLPGN